jgi:hypothetical protein
MARRAPCFFSNDGSRQMSRQAHDPLPLKPAPVRHRSNGAKQLSSFAPLHRCGEGESAHLITLRCQAVAHRKRRMEGNHQQPRQLPSFQLRVTLEFYYRSHSSYATVPPFRLRPELARTPAWYPGW